MTLMTFADAFKDIKDAQHKRVSLLDRNGNTIVPFNGTKIDTSQRLEEIEARFNSKTLADGVYQIHAKHFGNKAVPGIYYVCKGEMSSGLADIEIETEEVHIEPIIKGTSPARGFTQEEYNGLYRTNMHNEVEIERLTIENAALNLELDELANAEPEKRSGFLSEDTQTFLSAAFEQVIPIIDKVLDQKDQKIRLEALRIAQGNSSTVQPKQTQPLQDEDAPVMHTQMSEDEEQELEDDAHMMTMEHLRDNDPTAYRDLMNQMAALQTQNNNQA